MSLSHEDFISLAAILGRAECPPSVIDEIVGWCETQSSAFDAFHFHTAVRSAQIEAETEARAKRQAFIKVFSK